MYNIELTDREIALINYLFNVYQYDNKHKYHKEIRLAMNNLINQAIEQKIANGWENSKLTIIE